MNLSFVLEDFLFCYNLMHVCNKKLLNLLYLYDAAHETGVAKVDETSQS
jgi:hypothetical protein